MIAQSIKDIKAKWPQLAIKNMDITKLNQKKVKLVAAIAAYVFK